MITQIQSVPVVDAHQHFWRQEGYRYGLLQIPLMKRRFGDYSSIAKDYLPEDYRRDTSGLDVAATIHVEAGFLGPPIEETKWLAQLNSQSGLPTAALVSLDYRAGNIAAQISDHKKLAGRVHVAGVRQHAHWSADARFTGTKEPDILRDPRWREAVHAAIQEGWCIEIPIYFTQANDLARLLDSEPDGNFILGHAAMPVHFDNWPSPFDNPMSGWQHAISKLSQYNNLSVKLSGFWMSGTRLSQHQLSELVTFVVGHFGTKRVIFGSNFPIDRLQVSFPEMVSMFDNTLDGYGEKARSGFFALNAIRTYGLQPMS